MIENIDENLKTKYSELSLEKLVSELKKIVSKDIRHELKLQIEAIKESFNQKYEELLAEKKAIFIAQGGNIIDFYFSIPVKNEYDRLISEYKKKRSVYYKELKKQFDLNLKKRYAVIEQLKELIENADSTTMYRKYKEIQKSWRSIGPVPKNQYTDTWKIYRHHEKRFYDLLQLSNEFREIDFKKNLDEKLNIIEKAEALVEEKNINVAFKKLQELHEIWKKNTGPIPRELREETWQKFSAATKKIHDRKSVYLKEMSSKSAAIIEQKLEVVNKIETYDFSNNKSYLDWKKSINDIEKYRQQYLDAGKLQYNKDEIVWQKFKAAIKKFNTAKNQFYKQEKKEQIKNLEKKTALIDLAESLKDSEDWKNTTEAMKKIQEDWRKIGNVPRNSSDKIWLRFKTACDYYFDRFHQNNSSLSEEDQNIINAKKTFLEETINNISNPSKNKILNAINSWRELGALPKSAKYLYNNFSKQIDQLLASSSLKEREVSFLKFQYTIDQHVANKDAKKLSSEQFYIRKKIDEIVREINQLENNLSFFQNTGESNPLITNVRKKISSLNENLSLWNEKLKYLKSVC